MPKTQYTVIPSHYHEASGTQLIAAANLIYKLKVVLGLIPQLPPIGSPNYSLIEVKDTDFKPLPLDDAPLLAALSNTENLNTFTPLLCDILTIDKAAADLLLSVYTHKVVSLIGKLSEGLLASVRQDNLIAQNAVPQPSVTIAGVELKLRDDLNEYPSFLITTILDAINGRYDLLAVLPAFLAMLLRADNDTELIKDDFGRYSLNPEIEKRNIELLQTATATDLIGLYLFFCGYKKIQTLYWQSLSQILGDTAT